MRYECGMAPTMSMYDSRERAEEAFNLRASRHSWREVCNQLGYRSVGAAQSAVNRHVQRVRRTPTTTKIETHKAGIEIRTRALTQRFVIAFRDGDDNTLASLNREIRANEVELAKIDGMYEPEQIQVNITTAEDTRARLLAIASERDRQAIGAGRAPLTIEGEVL